MIMVMASNVVHVGKQRKPPVGMPSFCLLVLCCNFSVRAHFCERSRLRPFELWCSSRNLETKTLFRSSFHLISILFLRLWLLIGEFWKDLQIENVQCYSGQCFNGDHQFTFCCLSKTRFLLLHTVLDRIPSHDEKYNPFPCSIENKFSRSYWW